jgi:hypothetical protein
MALRSFPFAVYVQDIRWVTGGTEGRERVGGLAFILFIAFFRAAVLPSPL